VTSPYVYLQYPHYISLRPLFLTSENPSGQLRLQFCVWSDEVVRSRRVRYGTPLYHEDTPRRCLQQRFAHSSAIAIGLQKLRCKRRYCIYKDNVTHTYTLVGDGENTNWTFPVLMRC